MDQFLDKLKECKMNMNEIKMSNDLKTLINGLIKL